jgi:hypothetical protein
VISIYYLKGIRFLLVLKILVFTIAGSLAASPQDIIVPRFDGPLKSVNNAGQIKLIWQLADSISLNGAYHFELQKADNPSFKNSKTIYKGPDLASFISGLPDGQYYFRVRTLSQNNSLESDWSQTLLLQVEHQSLRLAFTLFGLGAFVFIATAALIFFGSRKTED